jgi:serine/threonine-protein kinase
MADSTVARAPGDRNLLFGVLALQMEFISRDALVAGMQAWVFNKGRTLGQILLDQKALSPDTHALLNALVDKHLQAHGNDPEKSLAAVGSSLVEVEHELRGIGDAELDASLSPVRAARKADDPAATREYTAEMVVTPGTRFRILRPHARGALGEIFVARDMELDREVALKQIQERHADNTQSRARFVQEARITGALEHPGVVPVYGLGQYADGRPYYAMRLIQGDSLKEAIGRYHRADSARRDPGSRVLEFRKLLGRFIDVCNAVAYAHSRGIMHRDLKPGNIMLGKYGETLVVDWGLAKPVSRKDDSHDTDERALELSSDRSGTATQVGSAVGTPQYMSPEQAAGRLDELGPATDVYSLGATLYCLLSGKPPFEDTEAATLLRHVQRGEFLPPRKISADVPPPLEAICLKAMALKSRDRYPSPRALADDVEHWLAGEPVSAYPEPWRARTRRWVSRHRTLVTATAATVLVATGILAVTAVLLQQAKTQAETHARLAEEQRIRAETNLDAARRAVREHFTLLSESALSQEPGTQPLRKKLLQTALDYYQGFLKQRHDDPALRAEVADAHLRVGDITSQIGSKPQALAECRQALAVFDDLAHEKPDDVPVLTGLSRTYALIGSLQSETGQPAEALRCHQQALALEQRLLEVVPDDPQLRAALAHSHNAIGRLQRETGQLADGRRSHEQALAILERLAEAHPLSTSFRADVAQTYEYLGITDGEAGEHARALTALTQSLAVRERLAGAEPSSRQFQDDLARSHYNIANTQVKLHQPAEALRSNQEALALRLRLAQDNPSVTQYQLNLARSYNNVGVLQDVLGQSAEALKSNRQALAIQERLVEANPEVTQFQNDLARCHLNIGLQELRFLGKPADALRSYEKALAIRRTLAAANPSLPQFQEDLAACHMEIASVQRQLGRLPEALASAQAALAIRAQLVRADPALAQRQMDLANSYVELADAQRQAGRRDEALASLRQAIAIQEGLVRDHADAERHQTDLANVRLVRAVVLAQGGQHAEAVAEARAAAERNAHKGPILYNAACVYAMSSAAARKDEHIAAPERDQHAEQYAAAAVQLLRQARDAGFFRTAFGVSNLRQDTDLDPLRQRDDFKKLLAELTAPAGSKPN